MRRYLDQVWHRILKRPYSAACAIDTGSGSPVVLLHGLGSSSDVWSNVITFLKDKHRVLAFDLVGFGKSPKPDWLEYNVDDHARAIIAAMHKQRIREPVILVGHSMGSLVAVRVARLKPQIVERLVLYEMPLYTEVPTLKRYTLLRRIYFSLYRQVLKHPDYSPTNVRIVQRIAPKLSGFKVTRQTWIPYVKSLRNTIMQQSTAEDMRILQLPMDLIYGSLDLIVLRGHIQTIFDMNLTKITTHMVRSRHKITPRASAFIATRIDETIEIPVQKRKISRRLANLQLSIYANGKQIEPL